jgi:hypothetical protein
LLPGPCIGSCNEPPVHTPCSGRSRYVQEAALRRSLAAVCVIASSLFAASQNFIPDKIFQGSDLSGWHKLGDADWRADNGKITGTPKRESGGWQILDHGLQDVELSVSFRCNSACETGILLRAEKSADGMKGVYISLSEGDVAAYEVILDP